MTPPERANLRAWVVHIRGFDAYTFWAKTRSAAKYQAVKACLEAGYFNGDMRSVLRMGFERVYLDYNAMHGDPRTPERANLQAGEHHE